MIAYPRHLLAALFFLFGLLPSKAQTTSHSFKEATSENHYCLTIPETKRNPTNFYVYLEQMSEPHLDTATDKKVFRFAGMGGHGIDKGHSLFKIEPTATNCLVSIKIVLPPKKKQAKPNQLIVFVWSYPPSVWDDFVKLADSTFLILQAGQHTTPINDGSYTFYEYRNIDKYNYLIRNPRSINGDEVTLQRFIKDLTGPIFELECN